MILNKYEPGEYAAFWGCDIANERPPREPGDGCLFYNFGSEIQEMTSEFLEKFTGAIKRMITGVEGRNDDPYQEEDLEGLNELLEYVQAIPLASQFICDMLYLEM